MIEDAGVLWAYAMQIAPGFLVFAICLLLLPRAAAGLRIALYIALFILVRDAMTPAGLWNFDALRISFFDSPLVLAALGLASALGVVLIVFAEREMRALLVWQKGNLLSGIAAGLGLGALIGAGALSLSGFSPRLSDFSPGFIAGLVLLAYGGNLLEEVLFRGYLQVRLEQIVTPVRAALLSGVIFAACHSYLAITVTDAGMSVLVFTAIEGIACGFVRLKYGISSAALTHGTAILLVAMPLVA